MLALFLAACTFGNDRPPTPPFVAETTDPVPSVDDVQAALAHVEATVRPTDVGDLSGRWSQPEQAIGKDLHAAGHIRRHPVQPGVFGIGMATAYRADTPLLVMAFEGVEVLDGTRLCMYFTASRVEWTADTPEAHALASYLTPEALNQASCADIVSLAPDRLELQQDTLRWVETRHD